MATLFELAQNATIIEPDAAPTNSGTTFDDRPLMLKASDMMDDFATDILEGLQPNTDKQRGGEI